MDIKNIFGRWLTFFASLNNMQISPKVNGTFIQYDMTLSWDDRKWEKEFAYLKEARMNYLVLMTAAITEGSVTKTIYPTKLPGCRMRENTPDIIDACLRNAQKADIKVLIGIQFNEKWWEKAAKDPKWLYGQMEIGNRMADELYSIYHSRYPGAFYGWYWVYEVDNMNFQKPEQFDILAEAIEINLRHLKNKGERLPFMISPFMNSAFSSPEIYGKGWENVFRKTSLGKGDIFCPQDSVGGGGLKLGEVEAWYRELRKAVDCKPGLQFWSNAENFDGANWSSATLDRFIKQLRIENRFVKNSITFSYSHYYSPNNIDPGFHRTYLDYLKKGRLKKAGIKAPSFIKVKKAPLNRFLIEWGPGEGPFGIYGYKLYRNGELLHNTMLQRKYGGNPEGMVMSWLDTIKNISGVRGIVYSVKAYDFAGNQSKEIQAPKVYAIKNYWSRVRHILNRVEKNHKI